MNMLAFLEKLENFKESSDWTESYRREVGWNKEYRKSSYTKYEYCLNG